uniref:C2H2-type domain-containing protein n=1 Tax=Glossina palpalis gambiensis TaxID=67801 RepID=A0A1B0B078_9MUSC
MDKTSSIVLMFSSHIYPILGSLLGVDTNNGHDNLNSIANNDLYNSFGYLNNNNTIIQRTATGQQHQQAHHQQQQQQQHQQQQLHHHHQQHQQQQQQRHSNALERDAYMQCKHCKRFYKSVQKLQEHVRKYCLKEKKYKCVSCEYRSRRKDHVLRHAKRKHCELYEQYRDDEECLFVIRNEDESDERDGVRYDHDNDFANDILIPAISLGTGTSNLSSSSLMPATTMRELGFDFGSRDLTITAVPILQESEEDDDDYDEDAE